MSISLLVFLIAQAAAHAAATESPPISVATCEDPAKRALLFASDPDKSAVFQRLKDKSAQNEAAMDKLLDRLGERAKWTAEQKSEFGLKLLEVPEFQSAMEEGFALFGNMMKEFGRIVDSKDEKKICLTLVKMMELMPAIDSNAQRQWDIMKVAVAAEAQRLGISLD